MSRGMQLEIKRKISSVKSTLHITRAMEMVATSRLQLFRKNLKNFYEYERAFSDAFNKISNAVEDLDEVKDLVSNKSPSKVLVVVVTGETGLCGTYNDDIIDSAYEREKELRNKFDSFYVVGYKADKKMNFDGKKIRKSMNGIFSKPFYDEAQSLSNELIRIYRQSEIDSIEIIHGYSKMSLIQNVKRDEFLPIKVEKNSQNNSYDFEPSPNEIVEIILPQYFAAKMYRILLESRMSEHNARQNAMRNATENAKKLIDDLTLQYNKVRQFYITQEVIEVTNSSESLKGEE